MRREFHVRSCESRGVRFPPATRQTRVFALHEVAYQSALGRRWGGVRVE
jgi:hypothetical protein